MPDESSSPAHGPAGRYYQLVDQGALEEVVALFAPGIVYDRPGHGRIEGTEALRHFFFHERQLEFSRHTIARYIAEGEWVVAEGTVDARTTAGQELSLAFVDLFRIQDGLITERRGYVAS